MTSNYIEKLTKWLQIPFEHHDCGCKKSYPVDFLDIGDHIWMHPILDGSHFSKTSEFKYYPNQGEIVDKIIEHGSLLKYRVRFTDGSELTIPASTYFISRILE